MHEDTRALDNTDTAKEEVNGSEPRRVSGLSSREVPKNVHDIPGRDNETPAGPDGSGGHQRGILGKGELFGGTGEVCNA